MKRLIVKQIIIYLILFVCLSGFSTGTQVVPLTGLVNPDSILVDEQSIYITDREIIYIFSTDDFKLKTKFGKAGEGPQEFKINPAGIAKLNIQLSPDKIIVNSIGRVTFFSKAGKFLKEIQISSGNNFIPFGDGYVGYGTSRDNKIMYTTFNLYDSEFQKLKEFFRKEYYVQANKKFNLIKLGCGNARRAIYQVYNGKIFIEGDNNDIHVFNKKGDEEYIIKLEYERLKIHEERKKEIKEDLFLLYTSPLMKDLINEKGYFPEHYSARIFKIADDNIYIPTYKKQNGTNEFVVLDLKGKEKNRISIPFKEKTFLLAYPYWIAGRKLYQVFDNEKVEGWELHITDF
jgi:hypothetical protein